MDSNIRALNKVPDGQRVKTLGETTGMLINEWGILTSEEIPLPVDEYTVGTLPAIGKTLITDAAEYLVMEQIEVEVIRNKNPE